MANKNWINGKFVDKRNAKYLEQDNFLNESGKVEDINKKLEKEDAKEEIKSDSKGESKKDSTPKKEAKKSPSKISKSQRRRKANK